MTRLAFAPDFVEEVVLLAESGLAPAERRTFRRARDPVYDIPDEQLREDRFRALHREWFDRLGLGRVVEETVRESCSVEEARILRAQSRREEGADLVDRVRSHPSGVVPVLVVRLRPMTILDREATRALLRHELMHVQDMLDPAFGYQRSLPSDTGALTETTLRDRYRVLWDTTIDGRLARAGHATDRTRAVRLHEFETMFPMFGRKAPAVFDTWFDRSRPTHDDLLAFARTPTSCFDEAEHADNLECH
jgi:hypothetical protein